MLNNVKSTQKTTAYSGQNIAVIGSGIAGLSAAWLLGKTSKVTVYEANDYIGGHSHTVDIALEGKNVPVDTGFIVFNPKNYPNLCALFETLSVGSRKTDMSFSASMANGTFEYSGGDNAGLLAQPSNIFKPTFWSMVRGILKFYKRCESYASDPATAGITLGELLTREGYSKSFIQYHLAPMGAAIWSSDSENILEYPALSFLRFFENHGLIQLTDRPQWRTVTEGSRSYVTRIVEEIARAGGSVQLSTPVTAVEPLNGKVKLRLKDGSDHMYDHIVLACHSDQARSLLKKATAHTDVLASMRYAPNHVVLHTDKSLMPKRRKAWASWNYIESTETGSLPAVSYWMNRLQHLPLKTDVFVTLNPNRPINPDRILGSYDYDHPVFDHGSHNARQKLWDIQGKNNIWLCGAYLGDGFHEDGIQSGLAVAEMLAGWPRPWFKPGQNARIGLPDRVISQKGKASETA